MSRNGGECRFFFVLKRKEVDFKGSMGKRKGAGKNPRAGRVQHETL